MSGTPRICIDEVRRRVAYDREAGTLTWCANPAKRRKVGDPLSASDNGNGYLYTRVNRISIAVHRLAFAIETGRWPVEVDHVNGDKSDNRWCNLREADRSTNEANKGLRADSTSGFKGVNWHKDRGRWRAHITHQGKHYSLGYHDTPEAAHAAYLAAARDKFGTFARPQ